MASRTKPFWLAAIAACVILLALCWWRPVRVAPDRGIVPRSGRPAASGSSFGRGAVGRTESPLDLNVLLLPGADLMLPEPVVGESTQVRLWRAAEAAHLPVLATNKEQALQAQCFTVTRAGIMTWQDDTTAALIDRLAGASSEEQAALVQQLAAMADKRMRPLFMHLVRTSAEPEVRVAAINALEYDSAPESVQTLVNALGDEDPWVMENARSGLIWQGAGRTRTALQRIIAHGNARQAEQARDLLERVFEDDTP
jgi:hypothetical protein